MGVKEKVENTMKRRGSGRGSGGVDGGRGRRT